MSEIEVIDGNQTFKTGGIETTVVCASNEGTVEERLQKTIEMCGAGAVLYNHVIGAKTMARNKVFSFINAAEDDEVNPAAVEEMMAGWLPTVGQRGGPKKSAKDKAMTSFKALSKEDKSALLDALMADLQGGGGEEE